MVNIIKSGLVVLNEDRTKFLVTKKSDPQVPFWLMPGGKIKPNETPEEALHREVKEELNCELHMESLNYITSHHAPAAGYPGKTLYIQLYIGTLIGTPIASNEIAELAWLSKEDVNNPVASETIREYIIPDLVARGILE